MADKLVDELKLALGDAYTIERELAGGGMSRVFVAKEHALGREVVIKVLPPDLAAGVNRERFRREVQLAARLSHPYIVPLLHAGEHGELLWFTMPFIHGESLRTRLQEHGALKLPEVLKLLHDVVEALAYAHSRGVIHRDIKPANILSDGRHALVTDFGVAKALNAALPMGGPGHTTSGMAIGTPAYMAPEQLAADPEADHRVDLYAVGLLAYELLSGVSPFAAPSPTATMTAQLTRVPQALHELHADIPPAFSALVQHLLAKSPEDRPPDAQSVLAELDRISGALAADAHRSTSGETHAKAHASSFPLMVATVGVLALVAAGFWWTQRAPPKVAGPDSSNSTRLGSDTDLNTPLPAKTMTHKDSLKLLEDLREQLGQADPKYSAKPAPKPAVAETVPLDVQVAQTDSLIRARLQVLYGQRGAGSGTAIAVAPPPNTPSTPGASPTGAGNRPAPPARSLAVVAWPRGGRASDSALIALQRRAAVDLIARASRGPPWTTVTVDTVPPTGGRGGGRGNFAPPPSADVVVFLGITRDSADSVKLSVTVRSMDSSTNFGYHQLTSDAVLHATSTAPFNGTLNDAARLIRQLRQLQPGQVWVQDMGRGGRGGPGGPFDAGVTMRAFNTKQLDSLRRMGESLGGRMRPPPKRRDSLP
jgi:serine/threonine-protein kinase